MAPKPGPLRPNYFPRSLPDGLTPNMSQPLKILIQNNTTANRTGHGSKSRTPSEHANPHENRVKWVVHQPKMVPLVLTHSLLLQFVEATVPCLLPYLLKHITHALGSSPILRHTQLNPFWPFDVLQVGDVLILQINIAKGLHKRPHGD